MIGLAVSLAAALPATVSAAPDRIALTIYRAPSGSAQPRMDLGSLGGFALVTETRTVTVPAGQTVLRFEGVADGIIPASALVTGLPGGTVEKNRDARLLSPAALVDGTLGREVTVRRIDRQSGRIREERATIVAVPAKGGGGVVMRTPEGIETWRCPGVPEKLVYDGVPPGLSAKPVLSITTRSPRPARVKVTLSYLASGFDWRASYVATLAPAGDVLDLFAWSTVANANGQAFPAADVQIVAGRLQRQAAREIMAAAAKLELHCFRLGTTTSDLPVITPYRWEDHHPARNDEITVTAMRVPPPPMMSVSVSAPPPPPPPPPPPEDLGDLKLYRVPEAVTVSANAQKQVALLAQQHVTFEKVYRIALQRWDVGQEMPAAIVLRMNNVEADGLGVPLPAGSTALYQQRGAGRLLLGLGRLGDTAKGEHARLAAGISRQIVAIQRGEGEKRHVTLSNAHPFPVRIEVALGQPGEPAFETSSAPLDRIDGVQTWRPTLPGNDSAELDYTIPRR